MCRVRRVAGVEVADEDQRELINCGTFRQRQSFRRNAEGDFLVPNLDYHRREADIFTRLSETSRNADTAAALLWLATEQRAELSKNPLRISVCTM